MKQKVDDLVITGGGIAGLAAAINAASEGLRVSVLEGSTTFGGQASTIKNIRNLAGHPEGLAGRDLVQRTLAQARGFGVNLRAPHRVCQITRQSDKVIVVHTSHGVTAEAHCVLITAGVRYRRLDVDQISSFLGNGVTYGELPDNVAPDEQVYIVGGGNSAGQAAIALAQSSECQIHLLIRGSLSDNHMSWYLIQGLDRAKNITIHEKTEVVGADGFLTLNRLHLRQVGTDHQETVYANRLCITIGADPHIEWAHDQVLVDERGYIKTGGQVHGDPSWVGRRSSLDPNPLPYETTPGIFAAGDVQANSIKRVASAIGSATCAVDSVMRYLGRR